MRHSVYKHDPAITTGNPKPDELFEIHFHVADGTEKTTYLAEYHARGEMTEIFTTDSKILARQHFIDVSEGDKVPMHQLQEFIDFMYPNEKDTDTATMDMFASSEQL